jgi:TATA-box binding protein (TBP) (component of TFIID and TFIIIB)
MENIQRDSVKFMETLNELTIDFPVKISTMTVFIKVNKAVSLDKLPIAFKSKNLKLMSFIEEVTGSSSNIYISEKGKTFFNSIVFKCKNIHTDHGTTLKSLAVKVFCNGNMHITGAKSTEDAVYLGDVFVSMLDVIDGGTGVDDKFMMTGFDVQMINYVFNHFSLKDSKDDKQKIMISLPELYKKLHESSDYFMQFNPERHSGIIIKAPSYSVLIFDSGNVIISLQRPSDIVKAYTHINELLLSHVPQCIFTRKTIVEKKIKRQRKNNMTYDYGKFILLK